MASHKLRSPQRWVPWDFRGQGQAGMEDQRRPWDLPTCLLRRTVVSASKPPNTASMARTRLARSGSGHALRLCSEAGSEADWAAPRSARVMMTQQCLLNPLAGESGAVQLDNADA